MDRHLNDGNLEEEKADDIEAVDDVLDDDEEDEDVEGAGGAMGDEKEEEGEAVIAMP